jgi:flagellar basal body-associated protein FliL
MENRKILIWITIGVLIIGGLAYIVWPKNGQINVANGIDGAQQATLAEQDATEIQPTIVDTATEEQEEAESSTSEAAAATENQAPTPRQELMSTDPQTVNLSSGDIQLIELFAFW